MIPINVIVFLGFVVVYITSSFKVAVIFGAQLNKLIRIMKIKKKYLNIPSHVRQKALSN